MKTWSIKRKLILLCSSLIVMILTIGGIGFFGVKKIVHKLNDVSNVQLPAVHAMDMIDMGHDGLRAVVYRALYASGMEDEAMKKDVLEELKEISGNMNMYYTEIGKLPIEADTAKAIDDAKPAVEDYIKAASAITELALSSKQEQANAKINDFQKSFSYLEEKLEVLSSLIEKNAQTSRDTAEKDARTMRIISGILIFFGLFFGSIISVWVVRDLMKTLTTVIDQLARSSNEVSGASSESASSATTLSEASTEQAASLQETMASVEQISAMVSQNAESAGKVKSAVDTNQLVSDEGFKSVGNMLQAIEEIKETNDKILSQMETSNKEFGEIVKIISEIGEKTKVINDIVFQTKLLSFNASVEAARAGEHGKGFAVVAEEVGNLAQMSGNAAKQITDMLSNSIRKVNEIVEGTTSRVDQLVEIGKDKISMGQMTAQKCREALDKISENARTVTSMVTEITHASKEQAQGIQEINKAISQLDQVTQQNSVVAQKSSSQAEQLNREAATLSAAVESLVQFAHGNKDYKKELKNEEALKPDATKPVKVAAVSILDVSKKKSVTKPVSQKPIESKPAKKTANSDIVPSSQDANFEEF